VATENGLPLFPRPKERLLLSALTIGYFLFGYVVLCGDPVTGGAVTLATPIDHAIPFLPWTCYIYSFVYTSALYPLFVIRCPRLFRRAVIANVLVITVGLVTFRVFPVTTVGLRADLTGYDLGVFENWGMWLTYRVDPPFNAFPSLHLAMALIASLSVLKANRGLGIAGLAIAAAIGVSTWTVKQHWIADSIAAVVVAVGVFWLVLRPYNSASVRKSERAFGWKGPAAYLVLPLVEYVGMYVVFRLGVLKP
jgi:membrane-associated phospholipid phosphatase